MALKTLKTFKIAPSDEKSFLSGETTIALSKIDSIENDEKTLIVVTLKGKSYLAEVIKTNPLVVRFSSEEIITFNQIEKNPGEMSYLDKIKNLRMPRKEILKFTESLKSFFK